MNQQQTTTLECIDIGANLANKRFRGDLDNVVSQSIPVERLMIETDAPYLAPRDYRPKINRNEPKFLPHILKAVAKCRSQVPEQLGPQLLETTNRFFGF